MAIEIKRCGGPEDIRRLAALADEIWHEHFVPIIGAGQVDYMIEKFQSERAISEAIGRQGYRYDMALEDGALIGYCGVQPQDKELFLSKLYLRKSCRGRGIARLLLNRAADACRELGLPSVYLTVNKHNDTTIAIYKKMGFTIDSEVVTDIGGGYVMDDYIMRLAVAE